MNETVEISSIKIKIGDKDLELTPAEVEKLYAVLGELLKVRVEKEYVPMPNSPAPYQPPIWIVPPVQERPYWEYTTTCGAINSSSNTTAGQLILNCN